MNAVILAAVATAVPLVLFGQVASRRWRVIGGAVIVLAAVITASVLGVVALADLWVLPLHTGLRDALGLLLLWAVFGGLARTTGPLAIPGPPLLVAAGMGAMLGEIPAAAILSAGAKDKGAAGRLALAAAGGGMIGRVGDPALLLFGGRDPSLVAFLAPLGVLCVLVAGPKRGDLLGAGAGGVKRVVFIAAVAIAAVFPDLTLPALGAGIVVFAWLSRARRGPIDLASMSWTLMAAVLVLIAIAGGTPEHAARGLELIGEDLGAWLLPGMAVSAALLSALTDGVAGSLFGLAVLDRAMSLRIDGVGTALATGCAVGGIGPLVAAGALRAGWRRWLLTVAIAVVYVAVFA
jgi:hypothetical protein